MAVLRHAMKIAAPRPEMFKAVSDLREMRAWHLGIVEGNVAVGSVLYLSSLRAPSLFGKAAS
jgi:hypothetical protein